jgi:rhamnogalacturonyl hydrolase YesR
MKTRKIIFKVSLIIILIQLLTVGELVSQKAKTLAVNPKISNPLRTPLELMTLIANSFIAENPIADGKYIRGDWATVKKSRAPKTVYWSYPTGVTTLAFQRVYDITHDEKLMDYIVKNIRISADQYAYLRWQKNQFGTVYDTEGFEKLWRLSMLDDCGAIGAGILETNLRHNIQFTPQVNELVEIIGNYITKIQYRLPDGTFWRPDSPDGKTIWGDDLYMSLPFLIRWAEYKNDPSALDDAALQIINYASYLQGSDGVMYHAYFVEKKSRSCCRWGRVNGWMAVAEAEVLSVLPKTHPRYNEVFNVYKKHIDGLIKFQASSGLWYQVIDHPEIPWGTETTCSAMFTYAIARGINKGWLDKSYLPVVERSLAALSDTSRITDRGELLRVCASTSIGLDLNYYNERPAENINETDRHGAGLMLLALTEMYTLQQNNLKSVK